MFVAMLQLRPGGAAQLPRSRFAPPLAVMFGAAGSPRQTMEGTSCRLLVSAAAKTACLSVSAPGKPRWRDRNLYSDDNNAGKARPHKEQKGTTQPL